jgi:hypothetical protein
MNGPKVIPTGVEAMANWHFELALFVRWPDSGFDLPPIYSSLLGSDGRPEFIGRQTPGFKLGADGAVLFWADNRVLWATPASSQAHPLGQVEAWLAFAPTGADLVVFGNDLAGRAMLTRVTREGQVVWQRTDLPQSFRNYKRVKLLTLESDLCLYGADELAGRGGQGQVSRVNSVNGDVTSITEFVDSPPAEIWVHGGNLFWVSYLDGARFWFKHSLADGRRDQVPAATDLQAALGQACGALPDGGALLCSLDDQLIWMNFEGNAAGRLTLAGLARTEGALAVAWGQGDDLHLTAWKNGEVSQTLSVALPEPAHLIDASGNTYFVLAQSGELTLVNTDGSTRQMPDAETNQFRIDHETTLALPKTIVDKDGALWLLAADAEGFFVVRAARR